MTEHQKEILYKKLYGEKIKEWKRDTVFVVICSVCSLILFTYLLVFIAKVLGKYKLFQLMVIIILILGIFGLVMDALCFVLCISTIMYYQKLSKDFTEYINAGLCSVNEKQDCNGQQIFCVDMGKYLQKEISVKNMEEYIGNFKMEKMGKQQCQN